MLMMTMLTLAACGTTATSVPSPVTLMPTPARTPTSARATATPRVVVAVRIDQSGAPTAVFVDKDEVQQPVATTIAERQQLIAAMPKVGSLAPDFTAATLDGRSVTLSQLRGHAVVINFWASWCVPCRAEAPEFQRAYEQHHGDGLTVLGVYDALSDSRDNAQAFVKEFNMGYPIPLDVDGKVSDAYRVPGLPTTFFIDAQGVIRNLIMGQLDRADLAQGLEMIKTW